MSSRDQILAAVKAAQPELLPLPEVTVSTERTDPVSRFTEVLRSIGGAVHHFPDEGAARAYLQETFSDAARVVDISNDGTQLSDAAFDPHSLADVDLAIVAARLGVAENGAVYLTDKELPQRVLPFIAQHLAVLLPQSAIVPSMHDAYREIGASDYGFAVFIAGPSKTADIEQSLVLGAHGARTMQVLLIGAGPA